jgi:phosphoribosylaminoimidazolecarboxamide formyltransferase / IMP cyclohydrolase
VQDSSLKKIHRALISVSDKTGLVPLAKELARHSIEILSTGGTAKLLRESGIEVRDVADFTGFPELLDGRVKTLHPKVHGGILGIRNDDIHRSQMDEHGISPIDLVVVNLYPFRETIAKPDVTLDEAIENIDIGGPAMIRSAAKNHNDVTVVVDPGDYELVTSLLDAHSGSLPQVIRYQLALTAFRHTSAYDRDIAAFLWSRHPDNPDLAMGEPDAASAELPSEIALDLQKVSPLRYGENPHQKAALYKLKGSNETGIATAEQLQGKELSYNNLMDADAAWELVLELHRLLRHDRIAKGSNEVGELPVACAIIKHTNPCGVGMAKSARLAFNHARETDPVSAFGGIIAFSREVDGEAAKEIAEMFSEVIIAPDFTEEAREILSGKKNLRVLRLGDILESSSPVLELRRIGGGGVLVEERDSVLFGDGAVEVVSERKPTPTELRGLRFAWAICKHVKSNAIVYAHDGQLVGVGAGQMSRVDSVKLGAQKALLSLEGTVLASDAFFPFRDGVDEAAKHGVTAVIQPGGSVRDKEVIAAADEHDIAMLFTRMRHFKH